VARESTSVEQPLVEGCKALGWATVKVGMEGWPDRLVLWTSGRHFWVETKNAEGRLTPAQKVRIAWLRRRGETVLVLASRAEVVEFLRLLG
jgi:hypothetical protein